jgi:hypothetical protein
MRTLTTTSALLLAALAASAQAQSTGNSGAATTPRQARAPLATPDDLEPAVDVGGQRVALIDRPSAPAPGAAPPADAPPAPSATGAPAADSAAPKAAGSAPKGAAPQTTATAGQAPNSRVLDTLDLGTTSITGNQELPKVLYIVPWKKSDLGDLVGRPANTLLDEVLEPVDPEVFERHLNYYEALYGKGRKEKE